MTVFFVAIIISLTPGAWAGADLQSKVFDLFSLWGNLIGEQHYEVSACQGHWRHPGVNWLCFVHSL